MQERIPWLDALRGIGVFLVVLGHAPITPSLSFFIFLFHLPLFFFVSGCLFNAPQGQSCGSFLKKKFNSLLVPYAWFSLLSIAALLLRPMVRGTLGPVPIEPILESFFFARRNHIIYNAALWFLPCLFLVESFFCLLQVYVTDIRLAGLVVLVLSGASFVAFDTPSTARPLMWAFDGALYYGIFFLLGQLHRKFAGGIRGKYLRGVVLAGSVFVCMSILFLPGVKAMLLGYRFSSSAACSFLFSILLACSGIVTCLFIATVLSRSALLRYLGRNSLVIFGLHLPIGFVVVNKADSLLHLRDGIGSVNVHGLLYAASAIAVLVPVAHVINRRARFMLGRRGQAGG